MNIPPPTGLPSKEDHPDPVANYQHSTHDDQVALARARRRLLRGEQNLPLAIVAGLAAAAISAVVWAVVTVMTEFQIGFMAIAVGIAVGFAVRLGRGIDVHFGILGAVLALFACVLGNVLSMAGFISKQNGVDILEVIASMDYAALPDTLLSTAQPMDFLFYAIAVFEGYKLSFRRV